MLKNKKGKLDLEIKRKNLFASINKALKPIENAYKSVVDSSIKTKESFPSIYRYFENILTSHFITKKELEGVKSEAMGSFITTNIIKRLPHIDESSIQDILNRPSSKSFLEVLTKGFGMGKKERTYTVLRGKGFKRVLIANRGEIALRIIRACRELGIESVAIYSEDEQNSLQVKFADKSYNIGKSKNYLNIKKIVSLAKKAGCDAIHPGYGFLSQNPKFALLCEKKRIKFIGPSSKMIETLGDKIEAKKSMVASGVPITEGIKEGLQSKQQALEIAKQIGFPVILKASAGGGGKGMRIVNKESELFESYDAAASEASNAFGNSALFIEKYIEDPRHIEFQILADRHGNVIHLGERDCSIQRRHQKLVEEAPSPALDAELRKKMGDAAVNAVKAIGYEGAGTIEFLLDKGRNFYFIEMNTRIQVEHGVTEMITHVDLVKEQIKIAEGAKIAYNQDDIKIDGHAIECRINAEDPSSNFSPSIGTVINYLPPGGPGIRISSPCYSGYKILPHFDSLIALLICHGASRQEAIARMERSLSEFIIEGVKTTIPFHNLVLSNKNFLKGNITTSFIPSNKIIEQLSDLRPKKEELKKEAKILIVTTAVSQYLAKKQQSSSRTSPWIMAARQESMIEGSQEE